MLPVAESTRFIFLSCLSKKSNDKKAHTWWICPNRSSTSTLRYGTVPVTNKEERGSKDTILITVRYGTDTVQILYRYRRFEFFVDLSSRKRRGENDNDFYFISQNKQIILLRRVSNAVKVIVYYASVRYRSVRVVLLVSNFLCVTYMRTYVRTFGCLCLTIFEVSKDFKNPNITVVGFSYDFHQNVYLISKWNRRIFNTWNISNTEICVDSIMIMLVFAAL